MELVSVYWAGTEQDSSLLERDQGVIGGNLSARTATNRIKATQKNSLCICYIVPPMTVSLWLLAGHIVTEVTFSEAYYSLN